MTAGVQRGDRRNDERAGAGGLAVGGGAGPVDKPNQLSWSRAERRGPRGDRPDPRGRRGGSTGVVAVLLVVLAAYSFLRSPFFAIQEVRVSGTQMLSAQDVVTLAGIRRGTNLLALDGEAIERRLRSHPRIERAGVRKAWPNQVWIAIEERRPVALLPFGDRFWGVDEAGLVIGPEDPAAVSLPVLTGLRPGPVAAGMAGPPGSALGAELAAAMPPGIRSLVSEVQVADPTALVLFTRAGTQVLLGDPSELDLKFEALAAILGIHPGVEAPWPGKGSSARARGGRVPAWIDLRIPSTPVVREGTP